MVEECRRRAESHRPAQRPPAAAQPDPAGLKQHVERAARDGDAAHLLDLRPRDRLVIGDNGKRLDGGARQLLLLDHVALQDEGKVFRGAECPAVVGAAKRDAASCVGRLQLAEQGFEIDSLRHA